MSEPFPADALRSFIHETLDVWKAPGTAVVIMRDGDTLLCEGFGLRDITTQQPVTTQTLFPIASCTKAFTTMALGILVEEGEIAWDVPVRTYMPDFKLHDSLTSERLTPRDLVTHRTGLPRHDLMWYASDFSRQEIFDRLQYLELSEDIRTTFQYNNLMYMVAGLLVSEVAEMSWEEFVQTRIFDVLGMRSSNFSTIYTRTRPDHATPYRERDGEVKAIPFFDTDAEQDAVGPAGNIVSCVEDMAHWLRVQTGTTRDASAHLVSAATLRDMHSPQTVVRDEFASTHFERHLSSYGLGWFLHAYKGRILVEHGGNINGFSALTSLIPDARLGVVVLCNSNNSAAPTVITQQIYDQLLGLPATDWNGRLKPLWDKSRASQKAGRAHDTAVRKQNAAPSHELEEYTGEYEHPGYGVITVRFVEGEGDALELTLNDKITLPLTHYHYDQFEAYWESRDGYQRVAFTTDSRGAIAQLTTQMEVSVADVTFIRRAERRMYDLDYLAQFVGVYEVFDLQLQVSLVYEEEARGRLQMTFAGTPATTLVPYRDAEFQVKGQSGVSIAFKHDSAGHFYEAMLIQPGAVFTATRRATL